MCRIFKRHLQIKALILAAGLFLGSMGLLAAQERPVVIYGDTRTHYDIHRIIVNAIRAFHPQAVFHTGDLVEDGDELQQWTVFNKITSALRRESAFYPMPGNHERNSPLYFRNFRLPGNGHWYTVDRLGVHFILLDSEIDLSPPSEQFRWLAQELADADKNGRPVIVMMHRPVLNVGGHHEGTDAFQTAFKSLLEEHHVLAVFSGHDHNYQRFYDRGITYFVTGGGGAPLYDKMRDDARLKKFAKMHHFCVLSKEPGGFHVRVYDQNKRLIDETVLPETAQ